MGDLSPVTLVNVEPKIASRALELLPLSHQDLLRHECVAILSGTVAATDPVLCHFVNKDIATSTFKCVFHEQDQPCRYTGIKRLNRALGHVRKHLNLRAFRCSGACGKANCDAAFFSRVDLNSHKYHAGRYVQCGLCGARVLKKNQERHHQSNKCKTKRF